MEQPQPTLGERIYRLKLLQGVTILTRDPDGRDGEWGVEERGLLVQDVMLLSRELPYPASPEEIDQLSTALPELLGRCQSQWAREVDSGLLLMVACGSYLASHDPGAAILDGLMPII